MIFLEGRSPSKTSFMISKESQREAKSVTFERVESLQISLDKRPLGRDCLVMGFKG